ncbi:MAG: ferrochelatase [Aquificaceae bacterium]|nr:MAG: ferrochelatase [Aquificaceae bacterium]
MGRYNGDDSFFHGKEEATGILLVNLGTPKDPSTPAVRRYLKQFLSDPRVVEIPRLVWLPILYAFVLTRRPAKSAELYQSVWREDGAPLLYYSQKQQIALQHEMQSRFKGKVIVELAMRYGDPSIESALDKLKRQGAKRILVLPLYPQYSATTTATTYDEVNRVLRHWRYLPEMRFVNHYHDNSAYIDALARSVKNHWAEHPRGELLLMSFHGLPKRNLELGDPYFCHCQKTARLLVKKLDLKEDEFLVTFQSRFGKAEWLKPYTDKSLEELPARGIKKVDVLCPGFPADCLETLEEMEIQNGETFMQAGGESYRYIPALNHHPDHIHALSDIIQQHTQGWAETSKHWERKIREKHSKETQQRATKLGARL